MIFSDYNFIDLTQGFNGKAEKIALPIAKAQVIFFAEELEKADLTLSKLFSVKASIPKIKQLFKTRAFKKVKKKLQPSAPIIVNIVKEKKKRSTLKLKKKIDTSLIKETATIAPKKIRHKSAGKSWAELLAEAEKPKKIRHKSADKSWAELLAEAEQSTGYKSSVKIKGLVA